MAAQKISPSNFLGKFCIISIVIFTYYLGAHSFIPSAKQVALFEVQGQIEKQFDEDNAKYFNGQLPPTYVRMTEIPPKGDQYFMGDSGRGLFGAFQIRIDPRLNQAEQTAVLTLRHEECHLFAWETTGDFDSGHGAVFLACEQKLLDAGAMKEIF